MPRTPLEAYAFDARLRKRSSAPGLFEHRAPTQSVCVADCYFVENVLDFPFASTIVIYR